MHLAHTSPIIWSMFHDGMLQMYPGLQLSTGCCEPNATSQCPSREPESVGKIDPLSCHKKKIHAPCLLLSRPPRHLSGARECDVAPFQGGGARVASNPRRRRRSDRRISRSRVRVLGRWVGRRRFGARGCEAGCDPSGRPGSARFYRIRRRVRGLGLADRLARTRDGGGVHVHVGRDETTRVH